MKTKNQSWRLQLIIESVVARKHSSDLFELIDGIPDDKEDAAWDFCARFDLGLWFYESLTTNDFDISAYLSELADQFMLEERQSNLQAEEIDRDYRMATKK